MVSWWVLVHSGGMVLYMVFQHDSMAIYLSPWPLQHSWTVPKLQYFNFAPPLLRTTLKTDWAWLEEFCMFWCAVWQEGKIEGQV